ncbi:MAG TPA: hypothetical protein VNF50_09855 [Acidimicrobiales bacterium]|nr:hypothetical protein [Acidimicrobiales bacterium]
MRGPEALWSIARSDLLDRVMSVEMARLLGSTFAKADVLGALAARVELAERMAAHSWLVIEDARRAGASWDEIDAATGARAPGDSQAEYNATLALQRDLGLVEADRCDPGGPDSETTR